MFANLEGHGMNAWGDFDCSHEDMRDISALILMYASSGRNFKWNSPVVDPYN
jgi:hypothetical protein